MTMAMGEGCGGYDLPRCAASGEGATEGRPHHRATVLVGGDASGGQFALVELIEVPGDEPPRHLHHDEDETLYVAEGALRVWLAGEWIEVPTGAAVFLPRGVEHGFAVVTKRARVLAFLTPAGFEGFYRDLGGGEEAPGLERVVGTAARYGCEITGPPVW